MNYCMHVTDYDLGLKEVDVEKMHLINKQLNNELTNWKNNIDHDPSWDQFKKLTNEYEFIVSRNDGSFSSTTPSTNFGKITMKRKPLSRSYFKMWEILHDFQVVSKNSPSPLVSAHLAEGPGGFIESLCDYIRSYDIPCQTIHGITLLSQDKKIPNWKIGHSLLKDFPISINDPNNNNGDLYDIENIDKFVASIGDSKCSFVTADGGFDFSKDFNNQETSFYRLLLCEIYTALCIQRIGGTFVVKVFDLFQEDTLKLLACCKLFYDEMYVLKPNTSRPANSEKYLIFKTFTGVKTNEQIQIHEELRKQITCADLRPTYIPKWIYHMMVDCITKYNTYYTFRQISYIKKTLDLVRLKCNNETLYKNMVRNLTQHHSTCCETWCRKYRLFGS